MLNVLQLIENQKMHKLFDFVESLIKNIQWDGAPFEFSYTAKRCNQVEGKVIKPYSCSHTRLLESNMNCDTTDALTCKNMLAQFFMINSDEQPLTTVLLCETLIADEPRRNPCISRDYQGNFFASDPYSGIIRLDEPITRDDIKKLERLYANLVAAEVPVLKRDPEIDERVADSLVEGTLSLMKKIATQQYLKDAQKKFADAGLRIIKGGKSLNR